MPLLCLLLMCSFPAAAAENPTLDEARLKLNVFKMIQKVSEADQTPLKGLSPESIQVESLIPIQAGEIVLFAVKIRIPQASGRIPPELVFVTDAAGSLQFPDIRRLDSGQSLVSPAIRRLSGKKTPPAPKPVKIPPDMGTLFFKGTGAHEIVMVSDPFCRFCGKAYAYLMTRKAAIKTIRLAHFPLPMHPGAAEACWAIKHAEKKGMAAPVIDFAYSALKPSREEMEQGLEKTRLGVCEKIARKFPDLADGMDPRAFCDYLKKNHQAGVESERKALAGLGIQSVPQISINGETIRGFKPSEMDRLLK